MNQQNQTSKMTWLIKVGCFFAFSLPIAGLADTHVAPTPPVSSPATGSRPSGGAAATPGKIEISTPTADAVVRVPSYCRAIKESICGVSPKKGQAGANKTVLAWKNEVRRAVKNTFASGTAARFEAVSAEVTKRFPLSGDFAQKIGEALKAAILSEPGVSADTKSRAAEKIDAVKFVVRYDELKKTGSADDATRGFALLCGPDGLISDIGYLGGTKTLVICPGMVLKMAALTGRKPGQQISVDGFSALIPYVFSRSVLSSPDADFEKLTECLHKHYAGDDDTDSDIDAFRASVRDRGHDFWAVDTVASRLERDSLRSDEKLDLLKASFRGFCLAGPGTTHGAIWMLISANARLMTSLGCPAPTAEKPACGLQGAVPPDAK